MLPAQSSAPEDGWNYRPKHVELIEIINKIIIFASSWLFILTKTYVYLWQNLAEFLREREVIQKKICRENQNTNFVFKKVFYKNRAC